MSRTTIFTLGLLALVAVTASARIHSYDSEEMRVFDKKPDSSKPDDEVEDWSPKGINETIVRYYFNAVRGTLEGFYRGLYNNNTYIINDQCLGEQAVQVLNNVEDALSRGNLHAFFAITASIIELGHSIDKSCQINKLFYNIVQYSYKSNLTLTQVMANLQANLFKLTGSINEIFKVIFGPEKVVDWFDLTSGFNFFSGLGNGVGTIIRSIISFDVTVPPTLFL
jgi:hypothetical protein